MMQAVANLDAWLETMRQPRGYAGPVAHWWESCYHYTGPGLDWRYEGILAGYATLYRKTGNARWQARLQTACRHLIQGQTRDGAFPASRFEANPGTLGTPHEAAAIHGLLQAAPYYSDAEDLQLVATRGLDHLLSQLWDEGVLEARIPAGFNDAPGERGRVPNKLATLAEALMSYAETCGDSGYLKYARIALDEVLRYQVRVGPHRGAIHQWGPRAGPGDDRFFPYYNARCIPGLVRGSRIFGDPRYEGAAREVLQFLRRTVNADGTWPQVVYGTGYRSEYPHWIAPLADILHAYRSLGESFPEGSLQYLLAGQTASGGFRTGEGFGHRFRMVRPSAPDFRDVTPVVGWNDKVLRLLSELIPESAEMPSAAVWPVEISTTVNHAKAIFLDAPTRMALYGQSNGGPWFLWEKASLWATAIDARMVRC